MKMSNNPAKYEVLTEQYLRSILAITVLLSLVQLNSIFYPYQMLNRILGKGPFFLPAQKFLTISL